MHRFMTMAILVGCLMGLTAGCRRPKPLGVGGRGIETATKPDDAPKPKPEPVVPPGATPEDGEWKGAAEGTTIRFVVAKGGTVIQDVKGWVNLKAGTGTAGTPLNLAGPYPVDQGRFTVQFPRGRIEGRFETPTEASGSAAVKFGIVDIDLTKPPDKQNAVDFAGTVAWKAARRKVLADVDKEALLGKWRTSQGDVLEFGPGGSLTVVTQRGGTFFSDPRYVQTRADGTQEKKGKYSIEADTITLRLDGSPIPLSWESVAVTKDQLNYTFVGEKRNLRRAP